MNEASIFARLKKSVQGMQYLRKLETQKANKAQQDIVDNKYRQAVAKAKALCDSVQYAEEHLAFPSTCKEGLQKAVVLLRSIAEHAPADDDHVGKASKSIDAALDLVRKEWGKHFYSQTSEVINTLQVISGLDTIRITACITGIKSAETWTSDIEKLKVLCNSLSEANTIIQGLKLDNDVITFLRKITTGKATMEDLNENVMNWLNNEHLHSKIKLSFAKF